MSTVISGNFLRADDVQGVLTMLLGEGFSSGEIASFPFAAAAEAPEPVAAADGPVDPMATPEVEAPGHDPAIGGALSGAAVGSAVGVAVGLVSLPLLGPAAAVAGVGAGAYVGSLVGALSRLGDPEHPDERDRQRQAGTLIAVQANEPGRLATAVRILRDSGASDLESTEGRIVDGRWVDFDADALRDR